MYSHLRYTLQIITDISDNSSLLQPAQLHAAVVFSRQYTFCLAFCLSVPVSFSHILPSWNLSVCLTHQFSMLIHTLGGVIPMGTNQCYWEHLLYPIKLYPFLYLYCYRLEVLLYSFIHFLCAAIPPHFFLSYMPCLCKSYEFAVTFYANYK